MGLDISERKQAEASVIALNERLTADLAAMSHLHELSTRFLASETDLQGLLGSVLDAALAITNATKGHIQILNVTTGKLGITVQRGYSRLIEFFSHIHPGPGAVACGTAAQTRQCVIVEDVTLSPLFLAEPRALQLVLAADRAMVCTPLLAHTGQLVGVLSAHFAAPHRPSDRDLRLLDLLARQAADFVERAQAEEALRQERRSVNRSMAAGVIRCSPGTCAILWGKSAYARWLGRTAEEITGRPIPEVVGAAGYDMIRPHIERVLAGQRVEYDAQVDFLGRGAVWINAAYTPTHDAAGGVDGWVAVVSDITERKRAEEAQQDWQPSSRNPRMPSSRSPSTGRSGPGTRVRSACSVTGPSR